MNKNKLILEAMLDLKKQISESKSSLDKLEAMDRLINLMSCLNEQEVIRDLDEKEALEQAFNFEMKGAA